LTHIILCRDIPLVVLDCANIGWSYGKYDDKYDKYDNNNNDDDDNDSIDDNVDCNDHIDDDYDENIIIFIGIDHFAFQGVFIAIKHFQQLHIGIVILLMTMMMLVVVMMMMMMRMVRTMMRII
jgi:hypothetical protein